MNNWQFLETTVVPNSYHAYISICTLRHSVDKSTKMALYEDIWILLRHASFIYRVTNMSHHNIIIIILPSIPIQNSQYAYKHRIFHFLCQQPNHRLLLPLPL